MTCSCTLEDLFLPNKLSSITTYIFTHQQAYLEWPQVAIISYWIPPWLETVIVPAWDPLMCSGTWTVSGTLQV
jgi:hypothetical protein